MSNFGLPLLRLGYDVKVYIKAALFTLNSRIILERQGECMAKLPRAFRHDELAWAGQNGNLGRYRAWQSGRKATRERRRGSARSSMKTTRQAGLLFWNVKLHSQQPPVYVLITLWNHSANNCFHEDADERGGGLISAQEGFWNIYFRYLTFRLSVWWNPCVERYLIQKVYVFAWKTFVAKFCCPLSPFGVPWCHFGAFHR